MISIITIVKNDRRVKRLLDILQKDNPSEPVEILVIDASDSPLQDIAAQYPKVNWLHYKNNNGKKFSFAQQRNLGIEKSHGQILVFIDADCQPESDWLSNIVAPIKNENEHIVAGTIKATRAFPRCWDEYYRKMDERNIKYFTAAAGGNIAFRREVFQKIGNYDGTLGKLGNCEDTDICWRATDNGYKIRYAPKAIVYHDWGNFKTNARRSIIYGEGLYHLFLKHPQRVAGMESATLVMYGAYVLFLPLTFFFTWYPLFIMVPVVKNIAQNVPMVNALDTILFNSLSGVGFIKGLFKTPFWRAAKQLSDK